MSKIRSKNTGLEKNFFRLLRKSSQLKFQRNVTSIKGKPDVVFPNQRVCLFIDSDFWHGWQYPRWRHLLKNKFWREKIENNRKRDKKIKRYLKFHGWKVIRIWEHALRFDANEIMRNVFKIIEGSQKTSG